MDTHIDQEFRKIFEEAVGESVAWTAELQELASGYFSVLVLATEADDPVKILECTAMANALVNSANVVE